MFLLFRKNSEDFSIFQAWYTFVYILHDAFYSFVFVLIYIIAKQLFHLAEVLSFYLSMERGEGIVSCQHWHHKIAHN